MVRAPECTAPTATPLVHRMPESTHREIPGGHGHLRVVARSTARATTPKTTRLQDWAGFDGDDGDPPT